MRRQLLHLLALTVACASSPSSPEIVPAPPPPPPAPPPPANPGNGGVRLLFIGNSLTYTNDVPALVSRLAVAAGQPAPTIVVRARGGFALEDHWRDAGTLGTVRTGAFSFVIMQQGPSTLWDSRVELLKWAKLWSDEIRRTPARPAIYAVWPPQGGDLAAGITNYTDAALEADALLMPVAHAWREAWTDDPALPLYGPDEFHQSEHGAWLAAVVITSVIYGVAPAELTNLFPATITGEQEATMKAAAARAIGSMPVPAAR